MGNEILNMTTPILLAALGGLFTELGGVLNIALEGLMLAGAFSAILITGLTGSTLLGTMGAAMAGVLLAYIFGFITLRFKANIFITGLGANLFAIGITNYLSSIIFGTKGVIHSPDFPPLPGIGNYSFFLFAALAGTILAMWIINKTVFGLRLRATGYNLSVSIVKGVDSYPIQMKSLLISGALSGLGGAALSLRLGAYIPNMTAGRGWIALVAIYLGRKHPVGIVITCIIFAGAEYFSNAAQGILKIPSDILLAFPYLITFAGMTVFSIIYSKSDSQSTTTSKGGGL